MRASIVFAVVAVLVVSSPRATGAQDRGAQRPATPAGAYAPARTSDGQPDIQGVWNPIGTFYNIQDLEFQARYQNFRDDPSRRGKSLIIDPPDGKIPYQPWALAKSNEVLQHHADPTPQYLDPNARCFMQGVPRHLNNREFEIFQPPGYVVVFNMAHHTYRSIPLNGGPHIPDRIKLWMGDSRGRWEGNSLVVDVTNNNDQPWLDVVGSFHSDAMHVTERLTREDDTTMRYLVTIQDPQMYTRPWTMGFTMKRNTEANYEQWEHACHEGERSLQELLNHPKTEK